jgi:hypothetical protein
MRWSLVDLKTRVSGPFLTEKKDVNGGVLQSSRHTADLRDIKDRVHVVQHTENLVLRAGE